MMPQALTPQGGPSFGSPLDGLFVYVFSIGIFDAICKDSMPSLIISFFVSRETIDMV
jgi:hypothetical protein